MDKWNFIHIMEPIDIFRIVKDDFKEFVEIVTFKEWVYNIDVTHIKIILYLYCYKNARIYRVDKSDKTNYILNYIFCGYISI